MAATDPALCGSPCADTQPATLVCAITPNVTHVETQSQQCTPALPNTHTHFHVTQIHVTHKYHKTHTYTCAHCRGIMIREGPMVLGAVSIPACMYLCLGFSARTCWRTHVRVCVEDVVDPYRHGKKCALNLLIAQRKHVQPTMYTCTCFEHCFKRKHCRHKLSVARACRTTRHAGSTSPEPLQAASRTCWPPVREGKGRWRALTANVPFGVLPEDTCGICNCMCSMHNEQAGSKPDGSVAASAHHPSLHTQHVHELAMTCIFSCLSRCRDTYACTYTRCMLA